MDFSRTASGIVLVVLAVSGCSGRTDTATVFIVDASDSVPAEDLSSIVDDINDAISFHRRGTDRVGVIAFGREPRIVLPISDGEVRLDANIGRDVVGDGSDLEAAIDLAVESFPDCQQRRILIITDGNQTDGDALAAARRATTAGVTIDVIPISNSPGPDISVDAVAVPAVHIGEPIRVEVKVSASNSAAATLSGRLHVVRRCGQNQRLVGEAKVDVTEDLLVPFDDKFERGGFHTYEVAFVPDDSANDAIAANNRLTRSVVLPADERVLFVENANGTGAFKSVIEGLASAGVRLDIVDAGRMPERLVELQAYSAVILADVRHWPTIDPSIDVVLQNTRLLGGGLVVLGGPNSFGPGGWQGTKLDEALPVGCRQGNGPLACVFIPDLASYPEGNFWQKQIATKFIRGLGDEDYFGLLNAEDRWQWGAPRGVLSMRTTRARLLARLDRVRLGRIWNLDAALLKALDGLQQVDVRTKMIVVVSNRNQRSDPLRTETRTALQKAGVSVVALGTGTELNTSLQRLAEATNGSYYHVRDPKALLRVCERELKSVVIPPIYDTDGGALPLVVSEHPVLEGIDSRLPLTTRFIVTTAKQGAGIELPVISPQPASEEYATLLGTRTYGRGRIAALTVDLTAPFGFDWRKWPDYDRFLNNIVSWAARPARPNTRGRLEAETLNDVIHIRLDGLPEEPVPSNDQLTCAIISPDGTLTQLPFSSTEDSRYSASFRTSQAGPHSIVVFTDSHQSPLLAEVNSRSLREYADQGPDMQLLTEIARLDTKSGEAVSLYESVAEANPFGEADAE